MISGGQTKVTDVMVGRQILCKENPTTPATSPCATQLTATITTAKTGLTAAQQKLWQQLIFTPAVLNAERFSRQYSRTKRCNAWDIACMRRLGAMTAAKSFKLNVQDVLAGKLQFKDLFGKNHKWSDFLLRGVQLIKKIPASSGPSSGGSDRTGLRNDWE